MSGCWQICTRTSLESKQVLDFKDYLVKLQAKARSNPTKRAYKLSHDDVACATRTFVAGQLESALDPQFAAGTNPIVNWSDLQSTLMIATSFGSGARGRNL